MNGNRKCEKNGTWGVTEIELHPNTTNKKDGFSLRKLWKPPNYYLKE
jgi:hypothetical protein